MSLNKHNLNSMYALGRDKQSGEWQVGQWVNQTLWSVDGSNKRICSFKDMVNWRYFIESVEYTSEVELEKGDRVSICVRKGVNEWYYVIDSLFEKNGKEKHLKKYLVGV